MKNDIHFSRRIWFMIVVLIIIVALFIARLVQIQLVEGRDTLQNFTHTTSSSESMAN